MPVLPALPATSATPVLPGAGYSVACNHLHDAFSCLSCLPCLPHLSYLSYQVLATVSPATTSMMSFLNTSSSLVHYMTLGEGSALIVYGDARLDASILSLSPYTYLYMYQNPLLILPLI